MGTMLYAPVIMKDYWDWYSILTLLNTGSAMASGNVEYYGPNGITPVRTDPFSLPLNDSLSTNYSGGAEDTLYSARIVSDQPLAAVVLQYNYYAVLQTYNCLSAGASPVYAPVIVNNYYGWDTSVNVQNTSPYQASVTIQYYNQNGLLVASHPNRSIPPYASRSYYSPSESLPDPFIGTARITLANQPVAVVVNQSYPHGGSSTRGQSYDGVSEGRPNVALPDVLNYYGGENWVSSVNVQNLGTSSTVATLTYQGQSVNSPTINQKGFFSFYVPNYWGTTPSRGPATVSASASQPVAVVVNHASVDQTGVDLARYYNGCNR